MPIGWRKTLGRERSSLLWSPQRARVGRQVSRVQVLSSRRLAGLSFSSGLLQMTASILMRIATCGGICAKHIHICLAFCWHLPRVGASLCRASAKTLRSFCTASFAGQTTDPLSGRTRHPLSGQNTYLFYVQTTDPLSGRSTDLL